MTTSAFCSRCLEADAAKHEEYAANYMSLGLDESADRELAEANRLRIAAFRFRNRPCSFHSRRRKVRAA